MSDDDLWRQKGDDESEDDWDDFGELTFADDAQSDEDGPPLRLGDDDTGGLPHWTEPPTGEMPKLFTEREPTDDLDVWAGIGQQSPVWQDERSTSDQTTMVDDLGFDLLPTSTTSMSTRPPARSRVCWTTARPPSRCRCSTTRRRR